MVATIGIPAADASVPDLDHDPCHDLDLDLDHDHDPYHDLDHDLDPFPVRVGAPECAVLPLPVIPSL